MAALLNDPVRAETMAVRARQMVEREKDAKRLTARLIEVYSSEVKRLRGLHIPL